MTDQPDSPLAGLSLNTAIHLAGCCVISKASGQNCRLSIWMILRTLIEMGLVEMRDKVPVLTNEGERALDWN